MDALYIAQSGLVAQQTRLDAISNNVANLNTDSYKRMSVNFEALMQTDVTRAANVRSNETPASATDMLVEMNGVAAADPSSEFTQGALTLSDHPLDVALSGDGFIELMSDLGRTALTRGGRLHVDADGFLAIGDGWRLASQVNIPPGASELTVSPNGIAEVELDDGRIVEIGQIEIAQVRDASALVLMPSGMYEVPDDVEILRGEAGSGNFAEIRQGFREQSNVTLTAEMVDLIVAQRGFQLNARVVQLADQLLETINNLRR